MCRLMKYVDTIGLSIGKRILHLLCSYVLILLIDISSCLQAQQEPTLAVLAFDAYGIGRFEAQTLTDRLRNNISEMGGYRLVDRGAMEEVLKEQGFQQTGCTSDECIVEVGKLLGVQFMLGGSIGKVGKTFTISLRIIDIETSGIVKTASYDMTGEVDELLTRGMGEAAALLLGIEEGEVPSVRMATLNIISTPIAALVSFDGEEKGTTPLLLKDLDPNRDYEILLTKPDYHSVDTTVTLKPGTLERLQVTLPIQLASLDILSTPIAALVNLDEEERGTTPLTLQDLQPNRDYAFQLTKTDYHSVDTTVTLNPGALERLQLTLMRHQGWLMVSGSPDGSRLFVNRKKIGSLPLSVFNYPTGEYELMVKKPGYFPLIQDFKVALDQETALNIQLRRKSKAKAFLFSTVIPGSGQMYQGYGFRGLLFLAAGLAAGYLTYDGWTRFAESQEKYQSDRDLYNNTISGDQSHFNAQKKAAQASFDQMKAYEQNLVTMAGALGAVWTINLLEVLF